jgi:hypothetical protein
MELFFKRPVAILLFIALLMVLVARGIVPALSKIDTDFPNYFTAAKIVADGGDTDRLYDTSWFQEQMRRYQIGKASEGAFKPFPPPTALLLIPLTRVEPMNALRIVTGVSVLCLICSIVLLARILSWSFADSGAFILLSGYAVLNTLRLGQPYILVSLSCILGYCAYLERRPLLAGICFGLFTPIKYFPIVILVYFAFRKEWKIVLGGAIAIAVVSAVSISVLGWKLHEDYLSSVLGNHLVAKLDMQDPFTASYQSFDSLFRRLFIFDAALNPRPLWAFPRLSSVGLIVTKVSILLATITTLVELARRGAASTTWLSIGILGICTLLLAPATATYHFVLLWLPVGLLVNGFSRESAPLYAYFVLGAYSLIGFFPYGHVFRFEGRGWLTMLAYPRLFLLLAIFMACVHFVWNRTQAIRDVPAGELPRFLDGSSPHDPV